MNKIKAFFLFIPLSLGCSTEDVIDNSKSDSVYEPYSGYNDGYDQDCADIQKMVWVGDYDPDKLDRDNDGWGCESYGD
jgi:hypothetical protein